MRGRLSYEAPPVQAGERVPEPDATWEPGAPRRRNVRGGGWTSASRDVRAAHRERGGENGRGSGLGFRGLFRLHGR